MTLITALRKNASKYTEIEIIKAGKKYRLDFTLNIEWDKRYPNSAMVWKNGACPFEYVGESVNDLAELILERV